MKWKEWILTGVMLVIFVYFMWNGIPRSDIGRLSHEDAKTQVSAGTDEKEEKVLADIKFNNQECLENVQWINIETVEQEINAYLIEFKKNGLYEDIKKVTFFRTTSEINGTKYIYFQGDNSTESVFEMRVIDEQHFQICFLGSTKNRDAISSMSNVQYSYLLKRESGSEEHPVITDANIAEWINVVSNQNSNLNADELADENVPSAEADCTAVSIRYNGIDKDILQGYTNEFEDELLAFLNKHQEPRRKMEVVKRDVKEIDGKVTFRCRFTNSRADGKNVFVVFDNKKFTFSLE